MEKVDTTGATRFVLLNDRDLDVLVGGETYTIERCSNEVCQTMFALMSFLQSLNFVSYGPFIAKNRVIICL